MFLIIKDSITNVKLWFKMIVGACKRCGCRTWFLVANELVLEKLQSRSVLSRWG